MKNKIEVFALIILVLLFNTAVNSVEKFLYEADEIEILNNGTTIVGKNNVKIVINGNVSASGNKIIYTKDNGIAKLIGNIKIHDKENKITIDTDEISFLQYENTIISNKKSIFVFNNQYFGESKNFYYFIDKAKIVSNNEVRINDQHGNIFFINDFEYLIKKKEFKGSSSKFLDSEKNEYLVSDTLIDLQKNLILGKDLIINFNKSTFGNNENDPRLKARSFYLKDNISSIGKGVFTTCKKNDKCPPWKIYAEEIEHDKKKETISYKNAWLKVYDVPIVYFPKFSHPDPSVKRKSGFLSPSFFNSSSHGLSLDIPYYLVLSDNKDLTFKPRLFFQDQAIFQSEYRQVNKNSKHIVDLGINTDGYFGDSHNKSHFFSNSKFDIPMNTFETSAFELNLEKTTNDTYLKAYDIDSSLIDNDTLLNSYLSFNGENENFSLETSLEIWEDLSKNTSDRHEFIYPNYKMLRKFNLENNSLIFSSYGYQKKYDTNTYEGIVTNDLLYENDSKISDWGFKNDFKALIKNVNTDSTNSSKYKNSFDQSLLSSILFSGEYPLKKSNTNYDSNLTPKFSIMYSPNKTKNMRKDDKRIDISNIYAFNRIGASDTVEGGASITLGTEYKKTNKDNYDDLINFNVATVIRNKRNDALPDSTTLGNKQSDIFGDIKFKPNKYFNIGYNFALDNDFNRTNYDSINTSFSVNNFITTFEYIDDKKNQNYMTNNTSFNLSDNNSVGFNLRRNKKTNATEFYDLYYSYTNDCLVAALEFNKSYYSDSDLEPKNQLFFSLTIIPFGSLDTPNVNN